MSFQKFKFKIVPTGERRIYRVLEMDGSRTFDNLSHAILKAFEFDESHLYMFSLVRRPYEQDGIYHPMYDGRRHADEICLQDTKLAVKDKFLYLYDFGDDWMFDITVEEIIETDKISRTKVCQEQGNLCQYPDWDDEDDELYDEDDELCDEDDCCSYGEQPAEEGIVIKFVEEKDEVIEELLLAIPAILQRMWVRLVSNEFYLAGTDECYLLEKLEEAGLAEVEEGENRLLLSVRRGKSKWKDYDGLENLQRQYELEQFLLSLAGFYGVIEKKEFYDIFCNNEIIPASSEDDFEKTIICLERWKFWSLLKKEDGQAYVSSFCREITEEILQKRSEFPVKWYNTPTVEEQENFRMGEWRDAFPVYEETYSYLVWGCEWNCECEDIIGFMDQLIKCVAVGYTEIEYFEWIQAALEDNGLRLTKKMKKMFRDFRAQFPSAALKGFTWGEYEKNRKDGFHQLSLFEEDLPFK